MDRASFSSSNGDSGNRSSHWLQPTSQSTLSRREAYRTNPNPFDPSSCDFDRTLLASFSGLSVSGIDRGSMLGSGIGVQSSNIEFLESNHAASSTLGHVGLLDPLPFSPETVSCCDFRRSRVNLNAFSGERARDCSGSVDGSNAFKSDLYCSRRTRAEEALSELCVEDLRGRIVALSRNQNGCRFLQKMMDGMREEEIGVIFSEVIHHVCELMVDPFGNYVVQKLVEVAGEERTSRILLMVTQSKLGFVRICLNMHGSRAMQKLMEKLTTQEQRSVVMATLSPCAVALANDMNGHHVILHCLKNFSDEDNKYLLNVVADNCLKIATDKSGIFVMQQCVECCHGEPRERLIAQITANALVLAEDRYGNYVVQHLLGLRMSQTTTNLLRKLQGKYLSLSCDKFASNVVEKCLVESGEHGSAFIIMELLQNPNVSVLLVDRFGNFVIQSALKVSQGFVVNRFLHDTLLDLIRMNYEAMRNNPYGKKMLSWLDKRKAKPIQQ